MFATTDAVGGVWTYATALARGLAAQGISTTLAVIGPPPETAPDIPGVRLVMTDVPLDWLAPDVHSIRDGGAQLARLAAGADIVHLNSPAFAATAQFPAPVVGACHSCLATWWDAVRGEALPSDLIWRREVLTEGYRRADVLLAPTAAFAAATAAIHALPRPPVVVHNGADPGPPPAGPPADFVFTAGRLWDEGKGLRTLDRAAGQMRARVVAAGPLEGEDGSSIAPTHIQTLGRQNRAQMGAILSQRPVFVSAASYEPFGLAVLEAAQAGCALVLADIASFRELWGGAAHFVPVGDAAAFAAALSGMFDNPALRARTAAAAQARAARYTTRAMVDGTVALYRDILAA